MLTLSLVWAMHEAAAQTFPDAGWTPLSCDDQPMDDPYDDEAGAPDERDLVGDAAGPAGFAYVDEGGLFVRMRLDQDPMPNYELEPYTWAVLFDTDGDPTSYEATVRLDGSAFQLALHRNTAMTPPGDLREPPDDPPLITWSADGTVRSVPAVDSSWGGDPDAFLDLWMTWDQLGLAGITANNPLAIRLATASHDREGAAGAPDQVVALDGDLVCEDGVPGEPTPTDGPTGDTGTGRDLLLEGGGGCATGTPTPLAAGWLLVFGALHRRRRIAR